MTKDSRRARARGNATRIIVTAMLALAAATTKAIPAYAQTGGDTALYVERNESGRQADDQQHATSTSPKGSLAQTGDPGARGALALALVGGGLTALGSAAKRRKARLVPVSPKAAGAPAAHLS